MVANPNSDFSSNHKVRLLTGGRTFFSLLVRLINRAQESIHLQVYIYEADATGQLVADALIDAAKRGVDVHVLVDGYGSQGLKSTFTSQFVENGVHFRVFEPLFKSKHFYIGRRMHQSCWWWMRVMSSCRELMSATGITIRPANRLGLILRCV